MARQRSGKTLSGNYEIQLSSDFKKGARRLTKGNSELIDDIEKAIGKISENPLIGEPLKTPQFRGLWKYRVGKYRLIYSMDFKNKTCYLRYIKRRNKAYK